MKVVRAKKISTGGKIEFYPYSIFLAIKESNYY